MSRTRKMLVAVLTAVAGWAALLMADLGDSSGELGGGTLTGPMIVLAYLGSLALFAGAVFALFRDRPGRIATVAGWLLALPWASWLLFPGVWCAIANCSAKYPLFSGNPMAFAMILLPPLALALRRWP